MEEVSSYRFLYEKSQPADERSRAALESLKNNQISRDRLLRWVAQEISNDKQFQTSQHAWQLFYELLHSHEYISERFSLVMNPKFALSAAYQSNVHEIAFSTLELIINQYSNAWRPKFVDLVETLISCLNHEIRPQEIKILLTVLTRHHELVAATDNVFKVTTSKLLNLLLKYADQIDSDLAYTFLASALCVTSFVNKAAANDNATSISKVPRQVVDTILNSENAISFMPYFMKSFFTQCSIINKPKSIIFPLQIIEISKSLDIGVPLIQTCREMNAYQVMQESTQLNMLRKLTERAIKEKHSNLLSELALIDFRLIHPNLHIIISDHKMSTEHLMLSILNQVFSRNNPMILFECGNIPSHILKYPKFISEYCEKVSYLTSLQLLDLVNHLVAFENRIEESALLFWTIKYGRLTVDLENVIDNLISNCTQNPWRFSAAVIGSKVLRRQIPPPHPMIEDPETHPIILHCFLYENYGSIPIQDFVSKNEIVSQFPSPKMKNTLVYKLGFIIQHLAGIAQSFSQESLVLILQYILKKAVHATNLAQPKTVADHCLALLHNTMFYENKEIANVFEVAALPLLPSKHFRTDEQITSKLLLRCAIISSMPKEFVPQNVSLAAFVGIFKALETKIEKIETENPIFADVKLVDCLIACSENLPTSSLKHNIDRIFENCPDETAVQVIPACLEIAQKFPKAGIKTKHQLIGICEYCYKTKTSLPFDEILFDDIDTFCAQLKNRHQKTINELIHHSIKPDDAIKLVNALNQLTVLKIGGIKGKDAPINFLEQELGTDFLKRLIDQIVVNDVNNFDENAISVFSSNIGEEAVFYFLNSSPIELYPAIFAQLRVKKEQFEQYSQYIVAILQKIPPIQLLKKIIGLKVSRFYDSLILQRIQMLLIGYSNKAETLADISILFNCLFLLLTNCGREISKQASVPIEIARRLSSLFAKRVSIEKPTYKHLKSLSKMFIAVANTENSDFIQYLMANFVSHMAIMDIEKDDKIIRSLQTVVYPLFAKCGKEQLGEVKIALHDSHRQILNQLYTRYQKEAQYTGKV